LKKYILFACVVLLTAFFSPKLEAQSVVCSYNIGSNSQPSGITPDGEGGAWVAYFMSNQAIRFGPGCILKQIISLPNTNPNGIAFDGTYIWVTLESGNAVVKVNATTGAIVDSYPTGGANPRGVIFDGTAIWVANYGSNNIAKISQSTGFVLAVVPVGSGPYFLARNPSTSDIWVANRNSANVTVVSQFGAIVNTVATGSEPQFVASDGFNMWVSCYASQLVEEFSPAGALEASYAITGHGQPVGIVSTLAGPVGVTHSGYLFAIYNNLVHYTNLGGSDYDIAYSGNIFWVTDITQGIVSEVN
jgi:YVTN family beta-propeller protein